MTERAGEFRTDIAGDLLLGDGWYAAAFRGVWHPGERVAVISDCHWGFERGLAGRGNLMPEVSAGPMRAAALRIAARRPARVVIAGDLFHEPMPDEQTVEAVRAWLDLFGAPMTIVPGNHDPGQAAMAAGLGRSGVEVVTQAGAGGWRIAHGHELPRTGKKGATLWEEGVRGLIVGHQHPAVILASRAEKAKMPVFAVVKEGWRGLPMIVLPTFTTAALGSNLLTASNWILDCPLPGAGEVRVAGVVKEMVLDFGTLAGLGELNG